MNLSRFNANLGAWEKVEIPFPRTLAEALFPEETFAIVHATPGQGGVTPEELESRVAQEGYLLDLATSGRKSGDFIMSKSGMVGSRFWDTPEKCVAYGSVLFTPCWARTPGKIRLTVLVVEDGEYGTGDCHGIGGARLWAFLSGDTRTCAQFRLACLKPAIAAKGTLRCGKDEGYALDDKGVDLVLPLSAIKSDHAPAPGLYKWDVTIGVIGWSKATPYAGSWQILQWFDYATVRDDLVPHIQKRAKELIAASTDVVKLAELLALDARGEDTEFANIVLADKHGVLSQHPHIVRRAMTLLSQEWKSLALAGGMQLTGLMALPDDRLALGEIRTSDLPTGTYIATRYPLRHWGDLQLWQNVGSCRERGVVYMSHATAAVLGGDFDGDYFAFAAVETYPAMAEQIAEWAKSRPAPAIPKAKDRRASELTQLNLADVMLSNADSRVGQIALLIARACVKGDDDLIAKLSVQLQIAVDKFKFNLEHDYKLLRASHESLPKLEWIADRSSQDAYSTRRLQVRMSEGTVGRLVQGVNYLWRPPTMVALPLRRFGFLFPDNPDLATDARKLSALYGQVVGHILSLADTEARKDAFRHLYAWLESYTSELPDPKGMCHAVWHATLSGSGTGSLPFHAFSDIIKTALREYAMPESGRVDIVGIMHNDFADNPTVLDGTPLPTTFELREINSRLRMTAVVDGKVIGVVSQETPVRAGNGPWSLTWVPGAKTGTVYAIPA